MATSFSGGGSRGTQREPPTMGQATGKLYHLRLRIECTLFCNLQSWAWTHAVLVIGLYELLDPTTWLILYELLDPTTWLILYELLDPTTWLILYELLDPTTWLIEPPGPPIHWRTYCYWNVEQQ